MFHPWQSRGGCTRPGKPSQFAKWKLIIFEVNHRWSIFHSKLMQTVSWPEGWLRWLQPIPCTKLVSLGTCQVLLTMPQHENPKAHTGHLKIYVLMFTNPSTSVRLDGAKLKKHDVQMWGWVKTPLLPYLRGIEHPFTQWIGWVGKICTGNHWFSQFSLQIWCYFPNQSHPFITSDFPTSGTIRGGEWERCRCGHSQRRGLGRSSCPGQQRWWNTTGNFAEVKTC